MKTVLVTGANSGLGLESAYLFAEKPEISKVIITSRNLEKGQNALNELKSRSTNAEFELLQLDTSKKTSVQKAIDTLEKVDIAVFNAGGLAGPTRNDLSDYGVTNALASNVVGHADLINQLIQKGKISESAAFVSSEAARGVKAIGANPPTVDPSDSQAVLSIMKGQEKKTIEDALFMYANVKFFSSLYATALAQRNSNLKIVSVSPGSTTGTNAPAGMPFPMNYIFPIVLPIMKLFGLGHNLRDGAERYVDVVLDDKYTTGGFYASAYEKITGPMADQRESYPVFANEAGQKVVYEAIQSFIS